MTAHYIFIHGGVPQEHVNSSENRIRAQVPTFPRAHVIFLIGGVPQEHVNSSENREP